MPESEIHVLSAIERMDARPEDTAYGFKTQESDVKRRINTLFAKEIAESRDEDEESASGITGKQEDYETVNEGMTTDTTEGP